MRAAPTFARSARATASPQPHKTGTAADAAKKADVNPVWERLAMHTERDRQFAPPTPGAPAPVVSTGTAPVLDTLTVSVVGPVIAEATTGIRPHLHLGSGPGASGVVFNGSTAGGPSAGGELFFSQVIRDSLREVRIGRGLSTDTVKDELDGGQIYKGTTVPAGSGRSVVGETDSPGETDSAKATDTRFTFHFNDKFETFLMWRADPAAPASNWMTYGSVDWSWNATATGVTSSSATMWLAPTEPFHVCPGSLLQGGSLSIKNRKPIPATHLTLPVHASGMSAPSPATAVFPDASSKDTLEKNCK